MKKLSIIVALLLMLISASAQSQSQTCDDAVNQVLPQLQGAKSLLEAGNTTGALTLIQSVEDILTACQNNTAPPTPEANTNTETVAPTSVPATSEPAPQPTAKADAPVGGYTLNPPPLNEDQGIAFVTFVHTSADSGPIDIYYGNQDEPVVTGLTYGTYTGLMPIKAGDRTFRTRPAGSGVSGEVLYQVSWNYLANSTWMLTAAGVASTLSFIVEPISLIRNNYESKARVRVINLIAAGPRVTVTDNNGTVFGNGLGWVGIKDTLVAPGEYVLSVSAQSDMTMPEPMAFNFEANYTYTLFIIGDGSEARPVSFLELPIQQDITRVKFINNRNDTVDIHARPGNEKLVANIESSVESDWITLPSGAFTFIAYAPGTGPTGQELVAIATQLRPQRDVTIVMGNNGMQIQSAALRSE